MIFVADLLTKTEEIRIIQDFFGLAIYIILLIGLMSEEKEIKVLNKVETNCLVIIFISEIVRVICEAVSTIITGDMSLAWILTVLYIIITFSACLNVGVFTFYEYKVLREEAYISSAVLYVVAFFCSFAFVMQAMSYLFTHWFAYVDEYGYYHYTDLYWIYLCFYVLVIFFDWVLAMSFRDKLTGGEVNAWSLFLAFPMLSMIINLIDYRLEFSTLAETFAILIIYICIHSRKSRNMAIQEKKLTESNMKIMLSQIQPHFMYNSLNTIYYLIDKKPDVAREAVDKFSTYLRRNINALKSDEPVPVTVEIEHTKAYLYLEKLRFDEELSIVYDIQSTDFMLPTLSLQPLVENAVKHGLSQKAEGGVLVIKTFEKDDCYYATVFDNGVGFDAENYSFEDNSIGEWISKLDTNHENESTHIGIKNVRNRLGIMLNGDLAIDSKPGRGTIATITIPK